MQMTPEKTPPPVEIRGWKLQKDPKTGLGSKVIRALLSLLIIGAGILGAKYLIRSAPKAGKSRPAPAAPLVRTQAIWPADQTVTISAMGTVIPAREIVLKARVAGETIWVHPEFEAGGFLTEGTEILRIDAADYTLALAQKKSALANARYALQLEQGRQTVARREWDLLKGTAPESASPDLALRKPHLAKARADVAAAEAALARARLNLDRTRIVAPFNAVIRARHVAMGSQVTPQEPLADLVATDAYWIRVAIPADQLKWIPIPRDRRGRGARARVHYHSGAARDGVVLKLLSDLEPEGRMARLLVSVADPLGLQAPEPAPPPLLLGEYVRVEIAGRTIPDAFRIPREALRDSNRIWVVGENNTLDIRTISPLWRDTASVLLTRGMSPGEQLVVSDISTPVRGMQLTIETRDEGPGTPPAKRK